MPSRSDDQNEVRYERKMGDSELSYYLPSRANGVNDMYRILLFCLSGLSLFLSTQVPSSRFQGANRPFETRESARRVGHSPPTTPIAGSCGGVARLR